MRTSPPATPGADTQRRVSGDASARRAMPVIRLVPGWPFKNGSPFKNGRVPAATGLRRGGKTRAALLALVSGGLAATLGHPGPAGAAEPAAQSDGPVKPASAGAARPGATGMPLEVGDKFKLAFYERLADVEKDKWGRAGSALQGFQQRPELSGDYTVQDDGTVALPLLGAFAVADRSAVEVQASLADAFEKLTGRKAFVTVTSLERPPVYVLGPVKSPGSFKYVPGMTVLHTIALAGGFDRQAPEPWQRVEAVREIEKRRTAIDTILKAVARLAVLYSERDGNALKLPAQMRTLSSEGELKKLIAEETERRSPMILARRSRERAATASVDAAKQEVELLSNRLQPLDELIRLREKRVEAMRVLLQRGSISNMVMVQAQSELSEAQQRRQDAVNQFTMAQQHVALAEQEQAKLQVDTRSEIENAILTEEQQIAENEREFTASDGILSALHVSATYELASETPGYTYEIVRHSGNAAAVSLAATGLTVLQPGDLVKVTARAARGEGGPADPPRQHAAASTAEAGGIR